METNEIYRAALETFGLPKQVIKLSEEIGEFLEAFSKCMDDRDTVTHVAEEMADVHNMLDQFAVYFGCEDDVERMKLYKLGRLEQRIEKSKLESNLRVNEPLTLDELQKMNGQPVWIAEENTWGIVSVDSCGMYEGKPFVKFRYDNIWCDYDIERRNLHCYRHKPEEV